LTSLGLLTDEFSFQLVKRTNYQYFEQHQRSGLEINHSKVGLMDADDDDVVGDSAALVTAEVTPSISFSSYIIVHMNFVWPEHHLSSAGF
jgi:hypothetical protein